MQDKSVIRSGASFLAPSGNGVTFSPNRSNAKVFDTPAEAMVFWDKCKRSFIGYDNIRISPLAAAEGR